MGVVYEARRLSLGRVVAVKMIRPRALLHPTDLGRLRVLLRAEAVALARLSHPNIIQIYEIGEHDGAPFISMEFVHGSSLEEKLRMAPLTPTEAARLVETLARAMHRAHQGGVVHRDLKPSNILLTPDEVPKIADFGLAKRLDVTEALAETGQIEGTPKYMAPEQAAGAKNVGPAADLHALGLILYECLTGRPPFQAAERDELLRQIQKEEPVPPGQLQPRLARNLETICLKCLEKQPSKRYPSAEGLAADLHRFLTDQPIHARRTPRWERWQLWARRNPYRVGFVAVALVGFLVAIVLSGWVMVERSNREHERALGRIPTLQTVAPEAVPNLLTDLATDRALALPRLREVWVEEHNQARKMRVGMALLPADPSVREDLVGWMLEVEDPREVLLTRDVLLQHGAELRDGLWRRVDDPTTPAAERLRALVALAGFDPGSRRWDDIGADLVDQMLADPLHLGAWVEAFRPISPALIEPLWRVAAGERSVGKRDEATAVLLNYEPAPERLADLSVVVEPNQFAKLLPVLRMNLPRAVARLRQLLSSPSVTEITLTLPDRERQARRRAQAAVGLLYLGETEPVWPLFRHAPDPEARSQLVYRLGLLDADPWALVRQLGHEQDATAKRAMILAMGEFGSDRLPTAEQLGVIKLLLDWFRDDPDPGIHGAIDWLLGHDREGLIRRPLGWCQKDRLREIEERLKSIDPIITRNWYVNGQGQTMTCVRGREGESVEFEMGNSERPPEDPPAPFSKSDAMPPHRRRIKRNFALATKPVTIEQFRRFLGDHPEKDIHTLQQFGPDPDCPYLGISWFQAARYCNWLSQQEGIPRDQWCYSDTNGPASDLAPHPDCLRRTGYRLPTEAEWEYACRAGATTSRYYGSSQMLLSRYSWDAHNSQDRTWPVGQKRPNDLGLFDMHGSVWVWVQDRADYPEPKPGLTVLDDEDTTVFDGNLNRAMRGSSFRVRESRVFSAYRGNDAPRAKLSSVGMRVARTCSP
jgi:formylglycine-generating enzyme required for sulfatase activity